MSVYRLGGDFFPAPWEISSISEATQQGLANDLRSFSFTEVIGETVRGLLNPRASLSLPGSRLFFPTYIYLQREESQFGMVKSKHA